MNSTHEGTHTGKDPYRHFGRGLILLDWMHRYLLPRAGRDVEKILRDRNLSRVLDVACGTGYTACRLARGGFAAVGLDLSPSMLRHAAAKREQGNCAFLIANAGWMPFNKAFDAAAISLALHEISAADREQVWAEMTRVVRPGGLLVVLDFTTPGRSLYCRLIAAAIEWVEKGALKIDPPHYINSALFRDGGGLRTWLEERGAEIVGESSYLGGNVGLFAVAVG